MVDFARLVDFLRFIKEEKKQERKRRHGAVKESSLKAVQKSSPAELEAEN